MNLIDLHINKHLSRFQIEEDSSFHEIFQLTQEEGKVNHSILLRYIHLLLDEAFSKQQSEKKTFHLHFEYDFNNDSLLAIAKYLLIRSFKENSELSIENSEINENLEQLKINLQSKKRKLSSCPDGASGLKKNKVWKEWESEKKNLQSLIDFYNDLKDNIEISFNTIFNCQVWLANSLSKSFAIKPYACEMENKNYPTFNLLNTKLTLNELDEIDNSIIDLLDTVILFDCEGKKLMQYFSSQDIKEYEIELKKYLIITFGNKKSCIQSLRDKINLVQNRFKINRNDNYTIIRSEIDYSLGHKSMKHIPVSFIGINQSHFWDSFLLEINVQDLYELRSVKLMNLYSVCFNTEIKDYVINEIFSDKDSDIISDETKQKILEIRSEDLLALKESLENVLDLIINSNIHQIARSKIKRETVILIDDFIINSIKLNNLISSSLLLTENNKLVSWSAFKDLDNKATLILSYQDQGKFPYYFYPNLVETKTPKSFYTEAVFQKFMFSNRYLWAKYNIANELYRLTDHPIRKNHFNWHRLKDSINSLKPQKKDDINWDLEQQYSGNSERETIKLKLRNERERTFSSSELFIYSTDNLSFKVDRIGDIIETIDNDVKYFIYHLDEIQEDINIYEKIIDTKQHEEELNVIRRKFSVDSESTGRLWKILLKQKATNSDENTVYDDLKKYLDKKRLKIVSLHHFKNNWLNPDSDSIAPLSKKIFIELCHFLELPNIYFTLTQRLRNASRQSTRQSTRQMNRLLQNLFNDGCFDDESNLNEIIINNLENYKKKHPLDELGIDEKYLSSNLVALVELIKPEIALKEIEKFKKTE